MEVKIHDTGTARIAEIISDKHLINSSQDGLDLLGKYLLSGF
ncbi:hypothetical protein [uncultured Chryseobacterium sp.]